MTTRFEVEAIAPFRLDLTVWAVRRRPGNAIDRWEGHTYRRVLHVGDSIVDVAVQQVGTPAAPRLEISAATDGLVAPGRVRAQTTAVVRRLLGIDIDLAAFVGMLMTTLICVAWPSGSAV